MDQLVETKGNLLGRLMTDHILRNVEVIARLGDGDVILGIVFLAILSANVRHVTETPELALQYARYDTPVPDEIRAPISIHAVSESLGMPYETTRRYVTKLINRGDCIKLGRGLVVPNAALELRRQDKVVEQCLANLRRLVTAAHRSGLDMGQLGQP